MFSLNFSTAAGERRERRRAARHSVFDNYGGDNLIAAFHGYRQLPTGARLAYFDFARMTKLRVWCRSNNISLVMPAAPRGRNWREETNEYARQQVALALTSTGARQLWLYGFSDGADQVMRLGDRADGVVFHSGVDVDTAVEQAPRIIRHGRLVLVSTTQDRTPADRRVERIADAVPEAEHVIMPRRTWWGLNHYWTPETNQIVWNKLHEPDDEMPEFPDAI